MPAAHRPTRAADVRSSKESPLNRTPDDRPGTTTKVPYHALVLLACGSVLNVMDRQLLAVLIDPIKRELGASDAAMGLLTGSSFAALHVMATVPVAVWADHGVRRSIIAYGLAVWSGLTLLTGLTRSYVEIFVVRVGVGIAEAAGGGPPQSLISDLVPPERRSTALAILVAGGPLGSMIAFALGGWLADAYGWRTAFFVFGAPGLLLALLIRFTIDEPKRGVFDVSTSTGDGKDRDRRGDEAAIPFRIALLALLRTPSIRHFVLASAFNAVGIYSILVWSVPYMTRVHALSTTEAGARLAIASGLFSALGSLTAGPIADRLAQRDPRWLAWFPALTSVCVFPLGLGFVFATNGNMASALLAPASFLASSYLGPVYGAVQTLADPRTRALAGALFATTNAVLGLGLAPPLIGWLNDQGAASRGADSIRDSLALILVVHLVAAALLLRAGATLRRDLRAKAMRGEGTRPLS